MKYMLLIYSDDSAGPQPGTDEFNAFMEGYGAITREMQEKGAMVAGDALESVANATSIRVRDGKTETTDGPFAETKETLGGYYLVECADLDEAIGYAAKIPSARFGTVEIRPLMVFD